MIVLPRIAPLIAIETRSAIADGELPFQVSLFAAGVAVNQSRHEFSVASVFDVRMGFVVRVSARVGDCMLNRIRPGVLCRRVSGSRSPLWSLQFYL